MNVPAVNAGAFFINKAMLNLNVDILAWFSYIDSKEYENTSSNKKNMLVKSRLFTVTDTNTKLRLSAYSC